MHDAAHNTPGVIAPPPLIYAGAVVAGLLLQAALPLSFLPAALAPWLGGTLIVGAGLLAVSALRVMCRAGTNVSPHRPTTALVVAGPYRLSRNPIYLSLTLLCGGIAALANALWIVLLLLPALVVMQRGVIEREERYLERMFGAEYARFKARVRRWI